jgi:hypothetical protein
MFANFELSSGGLVAADVKPKRTRTDLGCLPCMYYSRSFLLHNPTGLLGSVPILRGFSFVYMMPTMFPPVNISIIRSAKEEEV